jgi:pyruvate dehydrogenase E1 component alpha subunit
MHFFAPDKNFWGGHGIVAGQTSLGTGIAYAIKYQGLKGSCLCFMGDGAVNQGAYHEALNLAGLWELPIVYIIENNGYSMGTSQERSSAGEILAKRAEGYHIAWDICDGHDLNEVRQKTANAIARAHDECKPTILEIYTYRYRGHSVADPDKTYRTKDEIAEYKRTKDPINLYKEKLIKEGILNDEAFKEIDKAARSEAEEAAVFAEQSPYPPVEEITRDVYWEEDNPEHKVSQGRIFFEDPPIEG